MLELLPRRHLMPRPIPGRADESPQPLIEPADRLQVMVQGHTIRFVDAFETRRYVAR